MRLVAVFAAVATFAHGRIVRACQCDPRPSPIIAPAADSTVPPHPRLYVFVPKVDDAGDTFLDGITVKNLGVDAPVDTSRSIVAEVDPEYIVYEVDADAREGTIEVDVSFDHVSVKTRYSIVDTPPHDRARVIGLERDYEPAECGEPEELTVEADGNAIALRFVWEDGGDTIVPLDSSELNLWSHQPWPSPFQHEARLGSSCEHSNVDMKRLERPRQFGLYALFADGTSRRIGASQVALSSDRMRMPVELLDVHVQPAPARAEQATSSRSLTVAIAALAALAGWIASRLAVRRRAHRARYFSG
jgi:hypothetical protein